jgi:hypothetical protein
MPPALVLACAAVLLAPRPVEAHAGHSSRAPWDACAGRSSGEACAWEDAAHLRFVGTCRRFSDALLCVRQRPVIVPSPAPPTPSPAPSAPAPLGWHAYLGATAVVGVITAWLQRRRK